MYIKSLKNRCVLTARNSILMGDTQEELKKHKKYSGNKIKFII